MERIVFTRIEGRDVQKLPERAHSNDAGIDFYTPNDFTDVVLEPNEQVLIKTGLRCIVPKNCMLFIYNKSGVSVKRELAIGAGIVDESYTGEICINVYNRGRKTQTIGKNEKIAQGIIVPVLYPAVEMIDESEYKNLTAEFERGEGGFGSTGK